MGTRTEQSEDSNRCSGDDGKQVKAAAGGVPRGGAADCGSWGHPFEDVHPCNSKARDLDA